MDVLTPIKRVTEVPIGMANVILLTVDYYNFFFFFSFSD